MNRLRIFLSRLKGLFLGARLEESLDAELQSHLQFLIDENVRRGMSVEEARYTARRGFGGLEHVNAPVVAGVLPLTALRYGLG